MSNSLQDALATQQQITASLAHAIARLVQRLCYAAIATFADYATAKPVCCRIFGWRKPNTISSLEIPAAIKSVATPSSVSSY